MNHYRRWLLVLVTSVFWLWPTQALAENQAWRMELPLALKPGETRSWQIVLPEGLVPGVQYTAILMAPKVSHKDLRIGFFDPKSGSSTLFTEMKLKRGDPLFLSVTAGRCCPAGSSKPEIHWVPAQSKAGGTPVWPVHLLIDVQVQQDERLIPACFAPYAGAVGRSLLTGLATMYLFGMINKSHFLRRRRLEQRLRPLRWDGPAGFTEHSSQEVLYLVRRDLKPWRRALAWLRANPLMIGLFGGSYHETVELHLRPGPNVTSSQLSLLGVRNFIQKLQKDPGRQNRLFATALQGVRFFAVMSSKKIGTFFLDSTIVPGRIERPEILWLQPGDRLVQDVDPYEKNNPSRWGWSL